jgi:hypothetical protein
MNEKENLYCNYLKQKKNNNRKENEIFFLLYHNQKKDNWMNKNLMKKGNFHDNQAFLHIC